MIRTLLLALLGLALIALTACPSGGGDDDDSSDDDDASADDDDTTTDDDDTTTDDDDTATDDDDSAGSCTDDLAEENDTDADATPLTDGTSLGATSCPSDADWFVFTAGTDGVLNVDVLFTNEQGDVDATLYDADGALIDSSASTSDNEHLEAPAANGDVFYVEVELYDLTDDAVPGNIYEITATVAPPPTCTGDDAFEDNDSEETAVALAAGSHPGLTVCTFDRDYYAVDVTVGDAVSVDAVFTDDTGDVDIWLYDTDGIDVASGISSTDDEHIGPEIADETGTWILEVRLYNFDDPNAPQSYDLTLAVETPVPGR